MNKAIFKQIDVQIQQWQALKPFPQPMIHSIKEQLLLDWTYHSNALAGSSLDLRQTKLALSGVMVGGKTLQENHAVLNHKQAVDLIEQWVEKDVGLSEKHIQHLFSTLSKTTGKRVASTYRKQDCEPEIDGLNPLAATDVAFAMKALISSYTKQSKNKKLHCLQRAAFLHCEFLFISPFQKNNGSIARCLMNYELLKSGLKAVVIPVKDKDSYTRLTLAASESRQAEDFSEYLAQLELRSLKQETQHMQQLRQGFF